LERDSVARTGKDFEPEVRGTVAKPGNSASYLRLENEVRDIVARFGKVSSLW
jgi:hypothetical protein